MLGIQKEEILSKFVRAGSTDIAIMGLFDIDDSKNSVFDENYLSKLEASSGLIKLVGDSDGSYILHLYVDEEISDALEKNSVSERQLTGTFKTSGLIAYAGLEKVADVSVTNAEKNNLIELASGEYAYTVLPIEYPENYRELKVEKEIGKKGIKYLKRPGKIIEVAVLVGLMFLFISILYSSWFYLALLAVIVSTFFMLKKYKGSNKYCEMDRKLKELETTDPDYIVKLMKVEKS